MIKGEKNLSVLGLKSTNLSWKGKDKIVGVNREEDWKQEVYFLSITMRQLYVSLRKRENMIFEGMKLLSKRLEAAKQCLSSPETVASNANDCLLPRWEMNQK